jgi:hypothetical protein
MGHLLCKYAMYLGVTFDRMMIWMLHTERTVAKALHTYIRTHSLFKRGSLNINIKLMLYRALIRSVITYACPTWEYEVDDHPLQLQCLQNKSTLRYWKS